MRKLQKTMLAVLPFAILFEFCRQIRAELQILHFFVKILMNRKESNTSKNLKFAHRGFRHYYAIAI